MSVNGRVSRNAKETAIIDAAAAAFLEKGYESTTIEDVALAAGVSKPTVYRYFADKQALYAAFVRRQCAAHADRLCALDLGGADIRTDLVRIARNYIDLIFSPQAMAMFRVSLAEAQRFPELGRAFYEAGPATGARRLSQFLAGAVARGLLRIDDLDHAAFQLIELCKADLFYKVQFRIVPDVDESQRQALADRAVDTFLRAYR